jgi:hypothetical protein
MVQLFVYEDVRLLEGTDLWNQVVKNDLDLANSLDTGAHRRHLPTVCFNCHGLTLANRRGWLNDAELVLNSENYVPLKPDQDVLPGDLVAYFDFNLISSKQSLSHTAIVVSNVIGTKAQEAISGQKDISVVAKWGFQGEYIHSMLKCPYVNANATATQVVIYRFQRAAF